MLSDVVVAVILLIGVVEALEARVWDGLLVLPPGDPFGVQQVNDGRDIGGNLIEIVIIHSKVVSSHHRHVVPILQVSGAWVPVAEAGAATHGSDG